VKVLVERGRTGLELVAEDRGPGIADVASALTDHVSTAGTLGLGLPGVRRLMDEFELDTAPGRGTRVRVVKWRP
jgi:serine/threonine-protein kinase RsbT